MNWTGGTLRRTKQANIGVTQKQKAHFARARTQLQQGPGMPAAPFCPEYMQHGDNCEPGQRLLSIGTSSVRYTSQAARKGREEEGHLSPTAHNPRRASGHTIFQRRGVHHSQNRQNSRSDNEWQQGRTKKDADSNVEEELLEANRKRLLRQNDWIGVGPSRPIDVQFLSNREKSRTVRRGKLNGDGKAPTHRRGLTSFLRQTDQDKLNCNGDNFMSGALPVLTVADNIRIRIGSDASTTTASTQPLDYARSQTNSDSMLFDEEGKVAAHARGSGAPRDITLTSHIHIANSQMTIPPPIQPDKSHSHELCSYARDNLALCSGSYAAERFQREATDLDTPDQPPHASEATGSSYRLTHHMGGIEHPLKLVFDKRRPSTASPTALTIQRTSKLQRDHSGFAAEELETRHASHNVGKPAQLGIRRRLSPHSIDDDEAWRLYLDIGLTSSGHVCVDDGTGTSVPQPHIPARNPRADRTSWSQHAAKNNLTHVNLSKVSASLPAVHRGCPHTRLLPRTNVVKAVNRDEAFWQSCALDSMSCATKGYASTRLPLSNAVTSVSSTSFPPTPFESLSGQASRMSDDVRYAPHSGSRSITSAAPYGAWGRVESPSEDVQGDALGEETPAGSCVGKQPTHASLQNHASHDSAISSDTRTSHTDLDQRKRAWDDISRRAHASGSVFW